MLSIQDIFRLSCFLVSSVTVVQMVSLLFFAHHVTKVANFANFSVLWSNNFQLVLAIILYASMFVTGHEHGIRSSFLSDLF